jgi:hypothetical protein
MDFRNIASSNSLSNIVSEFGSTNFVEGLVRLQAEARAMRRRKKPKKPPKWQEHVDTMSPWFAMALAGRSIPGLS